MSSGLVMYGLRQFLPNVFVWLAAVLVVVQPLSAAACCCAKANRQGSHAGKAQAVGQAECCRREAVRVCTGKERKASCCCHCTQHAAACPGCQCADACSCQADHTSPTPCPAPPPSRSQTVEHATQPPAAGCLDFGALQLGGQRVAAEAPSLFLAAAERCVLLCRFLL